MKRSFVFALAALAVIVNATAHAQSVEDAQLQAGLTAHTASPSDGLAPMCGAPCSPSFCSANPHAICSAYGANVVLNEAGCDGCGYTTCDNCYLAECKRPRKATFICACSDISGGGE